MSGKIDFARIAADALLRAESLLPQWLPGGRFEGNEFKCGSVNGEEGGSLSFNISRGIGSDFASGEKFGDMIDLYAAVKKIEIKDAALQLAEICGTPPPDNVVQMTRPKGRPPKTTLDTEPLEVVPEGAPEPRAALPRKDKQGVWHDLYISHFYAYRNLKGQLLGYACRIDMGKGKKEFTFQRWLVGEWKFKHAPQFQRPVYGAELLGDAENANKQVIVVEGEKTADAARKIYRKAVVLTWPGGSKAVKYADWSAVNNRTVYLWPDHDEPGFKAMQELLPVLEKNACKVKFIEPDRELPEGWDLADATEWTVEQGKEYAKNHAVQRLPEWKAHLLGNLARVEASAPPVEPLPLTPPLSPEEQAEIDELVKNPHFRALGYSDGVHYFFSRGSKQIHALSAPTEFQIIQLAPRSWWVEAGYSSKSGALQIGAIADTLVNRLSHRMGIYSDENIRGLGAWWDAGRVVVHIGDSLIVDGQNVGLEQIDSKFIYSRSIAIAPPVAEKLTDAEGKRFLDLCESLAWRNPIDGRLLAGWVALAPICGALKWRPHIWIQGDYGSGKTWIDKNIVAPALGGFLRKFLANTTEAGLRGMLSSDALPVMFDEAGGETRQDMLRMQQVIRLMRAASADSDAKIYKGTAAGGSNSWEIRSMFCNSSTSSVAQEKQDLSRITFLTLEGLKRTPETDRQNAAAAVALLNDDFAHRLRSRIISLVPVIRKNCETFALAAAKVLGSRRAGDQVGTLLAGAYALVTSAEITAEKADEWMALHRAEIELQKAEAESHVDEKLECLRAILVQKLAYEVPTSGGGYSRTEKTVGELILRARDDLNSPEERALARNGIKANAGPGKQFFAVSSNHEFIRKALDSTPFARGWGRVLRRVDKSVYKVVYFSPGDTSGAVLLPISLIDTGAAKQAELIPPEPEPVDPADESYSG